MVPAYANISLHAVLNTLNHLGFWAQIAICLAFFSFGMVTGIALTLYRIQNRRSLNRPLASRRRSDGVIWLAGYRQNPSLNRTRTKNRYR
jgi:hypothetical protein